MEMMVKKNENTKKESIEWPNRMWIQYKLAFMDKKTEPEYFANSPENILEFLFEREKNKKKSCWYVVHIFHALALLFHFPLNYLHGKWKCIP